MKKLYNILIISLISTFSIAQSLPTSTLTDLSGKQVSTKSLIKKDTTTIISFWATWCKPCLKEIEAINENLTDWNKSTPIRFVAISVDDSRSKGKVPTLASAKGWKFDVFIDENGDFQHLMNVLNVPHTFIFDKKGKQIYQHNTYAEGDEEEYFSILMKHLK